ncbi:hypothetical protein SD70_02660 [Gordoniibacillus kamchatkensis]|uniref:Helix-turn-helix domain-containing protein n=1 Tax=Gordoniibacillus kamchatkensis TaxID=1590651 RepID=A0ABR5AP16_9BACL|nr:hypothetical protein [Paenibacillus sp. VKM B-2647]KIL42102.1 hypothetical protein SD70_02660 [Paenibacillus sp. VKM B-2647]
MQAVEVPIEYDKWGRMKYHPEFHFNHKKPYSTKESAYIVQNYRRGEVKNLALIIGRTEHCIRSKVDYFRKTGQFDRLMQLDIGDWEPNDPN